MPVGQEEGLALTREELRSEIGFFLGFGRNPSAWSESDLSLINSCLTKGLRQFYTPPPLPGENGVVHTWSFLEPVSTVTLYPDRSVSGETVAFQAYDPENDATTISGTGTPFVASMVGAEIEITGVGKAKIVAVSSTTLCILAGNVTFSGARTYALRSGNRFALSPYVSGAIGPMWHETHAGQRRVDVLPYPEIQARIARDDSPKGLAAAVGIQTYLDHGKWRRQLWYAIPYPLPATQHVLAFRARTTTIPESDGNPFILGATQHAETIIASCLAAAEVRVMNQRGTQYDEFIERLSASVSIDRRINAAERFGILNDPSSTAWPRDEDDETRCGRYDVFVNGRQM